MTQWHNFIKYYVELADFKGNNLAGSHFQLSMIQT